MKILQKLQQEAGYSLVEVLVAILILSIAIIPMVGMFDAGLRASLVGSNYDKARALANEKLEEVKALDFNTAKAKYQPGPSQACDPAPPAGSGFGCKVQTSLAALGNSAISTGLSSGNMMEVKVTVTWGASNSYTTTGLVSK